ncbi:related to phosphate transport protein, mitochondrial [Hanseniaspora guilliermondii]|uniref:Related to phosphate transport protein, mitochondrial n=1 Tax=Hanseniaspora guilliermondii TaxID=56406 RepID=A0A1L0B4F3_9ASCO|nr:related to phosphate transport protein, mitochondrial [Hanseniaspora guilliermondii]
MSEITNSIPLYSPAYFGYSFLGGAISCSFTHSAITCLDLIKTRAQVSSKNSIQLSFKDFLNQKQNGLKLLYTGGLTTFFGYGLQGFGKYGFYEIFKYKYSQMFPQNFNQTYVYLLASASAEFIADILLCPLEAVKIKQQTHIKDNNVFLNYNKSHLSMTSTFKDLLKEGKLYTGIVPLWLRQIPYTMVKFTTFEKIVEFIYEQLNLEKDKMNKLQQASVSFVSGFFAGTMCAIVSNPADVMVSKLNSPLEDPNAKAVIKSTGERLSYEYAKIGFKGLWMGLPTRIIMISCLTSMQWLIYDSFKIAVGLPTTGGH